MVIAHVYTILYHLILFVHTGPAYLILILDFGVSMDIMLSCRYLVSVVQVEL